MPTILVIGDKLFRIEDRVERELLNWSTAPRTADEVAPEIREKASRIIRDLTDLVIPPKKRDSAPIPDAKPYASKADTKTSEPKFQMADDVKGSSSKS